MSIRLKLIILFLAISSIPVILTILLIGNINESILLIVFIMLAVVEIIAIIFAKLIADPIKKLTNATKDIAEGKFDTKITINTEDEIGHLARSFGKMAIKLGESYATLEARVHDRTQNLENANIIAQNLSLQAAGTHERLK